MQPEHIIAATVVLGLCFLSIMALVTCFLIHKHPKRPIDDIQFMDGSNEHHEQPGRISSSWKRIFTIKQEHAKGRWVPGVSSIIKAGDNGLYSSAIIHDLQAHPADISLESMYEVFADRLRSRSLNERTSYTGHIPKFLATTKRVPVNLRRAQSQSQSIPSRAASRRHVDDSKKSRRKSLDLSAVERGLTSGYSIKKPTLVLAPLSSGPSIFSQEQATQQLWMKDGQLVQQLHGSAAIKISPAELAALSTVLGCSLDFSGQGAETQSSEGAFGVSISSSLLEGGRTQIVLRGPSRASPTIPAQGSGYSTLFAKHLAAGSLPFNQNKEIIDSILVTAHTLKTLQTGTALYLYECNFKTPQSRFLSSLPTSRELKFHIASTSTQVQPTTLLTDAVAWLPFVGGLTPLASVPLIKSVKFIAAGGLPPARLLQRLEGLVDKVNKHSPHLRLFGSLYDQQSGGLLYRERDRLGKLATNTGAPDSLAEKVSRIHRYTTLLQRLMALVPKGKTEDVLAAVRQATKKELEQSYGNAVIAHRNHPSRSSLIIDSHGWPQSDARSKRMSTQSYVSTYRSNRSSTASMGSAMSPSSLGGPSDQNLGKELEQVLKSELPLSVNSIAFVARMVLVAWTLSVEQVAWEAGEEGFRVPDLTAMPGNMVLC